MKISRSTGYGLLAVCYVAMNQKEQGLVASNNISKEYNIPLVYLLKILLQLVRANVLRSKRGPHGGFTLAQPPRKITMLQIIEAIDGPMVERLNLVEQAPKEKFSSKAEQAYDKAIAQVITVLEKTKLADLLKP